MGDWDGWALCKRAKPGWEWGVQHFCWGTAPVERKPIVVVGVPLRGVATSSSEVLSLCLSLGNLA